MINFKTIQFRWIWRNYSRGISNSKAIAFRIRQGDGVWQHQQGIDLLHFAGRPENHADLDFRRERIPAQRRPLANSSSRSGRDRSYAVHFAQIGRVLQICLNPSNPSSHFNSCIFKDVKHMLTLRHFGQNKYTYIEIKYVVILNGNLALWKNKESTWTR